MEDYYIDRNFDSDGESPPEARESSSFNKRFNNVQMIIKTLTSGPQMMMKCKDPCSPHPPTQGTISKPSVKPKARLTPLFKEKTRQPRVFNPSNDNLSNSKFKAKLEYIVEIICTKRDIKEQVIQRYVMEFVDTYDITFPKNNDKLTLCVLYCIVMSCRLNDLYFDIRLLSVELNIPYKDIVDAFDEMIPNLTKDDEATGKLLDVVYNTDKNKLIDDYINCLRYIVSDFKIPDQDITYRLTDDDVEEYRKNCRCIFEMMDVDIKCEYERQFCVTPDKVYIYAMFVILKGKHKTTTERYICEYLAGKFQIPRVTIEKMKRLVTKCRSLLNK